MKALTAQARNDTGEPLRAGSLVIVVIRQSGEPISIVRKIPHPLRINGVFSEVFGTPIFCLTEKDAPCVADEGVVALTETLEPGQIGTVIIQGPAPVLSGHCNV